jgi:hypothetical protein
MSAIDTPINFAELATQPDNVILAALKEYIPHAVKKKLAQDPKFQTPGLVVHKNIGELPETIQQEILAHIQPHLQPIRSLGEANIAKASMQVPDHIIKQAGEYRGKALRKAFDFVTEYTFNMVGKKPKGTNSTELAAAAALLGGGPEGPGSLVPEGLSHYLSSDIKEAHSKVGRFVDDSMEGVAVLAKEKAERLAAYEAANIEISIEKTSQQATFPQGFAANAAAELLDKSEQAAEKGAKAVQTAESLLSRANKMHWGAKTAIIGGTVALGATLGYWAYSVISSKPKQQGSGKSV